MNKTDYWNSYVQYLEAELPYFPMAFLLFHHLSHCHSLSNNALSHNLLPCSPLFFLNSPFSFPFLSVSSLKIYIHFLTFFFINEVIPAFTLLERNISLDSFIQDVWQLSIIANVSHTILSKRAGGSSGKLPFHTKILSSW